MDQTDQNLFTSGQVAARINLPRWQLLYLIEHGDLPGASVQVPGRRLFTVDDVHRIIEAMEERRTTEKRNANESK